MPAQKGLRKHNLKKSPRFEARGRETRKLKGNEVPKETVIYRIVKLTVSEPGLGPKTSWPSSQLDPLDQLTHF